MRTWGFFAAAVAVCAMAVPGAWAGAADSVPLIGGTDRARHVFSVTGLVSNTTVGAGVFCTSLEKKKDVRIAIEVFDELTGAAINDITTGFTTQGVPEILSPGETVTMELSGDGAVTFTNHDANVTATLSSGSARIVSTSSKLMCAAILLDKANALPGFATALPVVAKPQQKGE